MCESMIGCLNDPLACRLLIVRRSSFVVYRRCSSFVVYRRRSSFVVHRWSSFIVRRCSSFVVYRRRSSLVVVHRWSLFIFRRRSSFVTGAGGVLARGRPNSCGLLPRRGHRLRRHGDSQAHCHRRAWTTSSHRLLLPRESVSQQVSQSVSQATCWQLFGRFIDSSIRNALMH